MNPQDIYNERIRGDNVKMAEYKNNINKNNISDKLKSMIAELNRRRTELNRRFSYDLTIQHRPITWGLITDTDFIWDDINKSIEYEVLLSSALEIIEKDKQKEENCNWFSV
jgi:hypothetical protein